MEVLSGELSCMWICGQVFLEANILTSMISIFVVKNEQRQRCFESLMFFEMAEPGCSKLTTSLVNISLKFQTLISEIRQYFWLKNVRRF